jgi:hypothetical protein
MLRLMVKAKTPWVDSKGVTRSPFEGLTLLSSDAKAELNHSAQVDLVAWTIGIVADDWPRPDTSKSRGDQGSTRHSLSYEDAEAYFPSLSPLWASVIAWLIHRAQSARIFLKDELWDGTRWQDVSMLAEPLAKDHGFRTWSTGKPGLVGLEAGDTGARALVGQWWPSAAGLLAGVGFDHLDDEAVGRLERGELTTRDLRRVQWLFQTASSFHNLGLTVLLRADSWERVEEQLAQEGWVDDRPVEFLIPDLG